MPSRDPGGGQRSAAPSRLKMVRGEGDIEASRAEVEKAYSQADAYRKENERLKKQLDQVLCPPAPASRLPPPPAPLLAHTPLVPVRDFGRSLRPRFC